MKGNTFRKTVSALASVAMVAQLGFIIPASAEELSVEILNSGVRQLQRHKTLPNRIAVEFFCQIF